MIELETPQIEPVAEDGTYAKYEAGPLQAGYGVTLGNALRRVLLSSLLAGEVDDSEIELKPADWWKARGVTTIFGRQVAGIDRETRDAIAAPIMGKGYVQIDINRAQAARYGISVEDIQNEIEVALHQRRKS